MISTTMTTKVTARGVALARSAPKARRTAVARAGASDREMWYPGAQAPAYLDGSMAGDYGARECERVFFVFFCPRPRRRARRVARVVAARHARAGQDTIRSGVGDWWIWRAKRRARERERERGVPLRRACRTCVKSD